MIQKITRRKIRKIVIQFASREGGIHASLRHYLQRSDAADIRQALIVLHYLAKHSYRWPDETLPLLVTILQNRQLGWVHEDILRLLFDYQAMTGDMAFYQDLMDLLYHDDDNVWMGLVHFLARNNSRLLLPYMDWLIGEARRRNLPSLLYQLQYIPERLYRW